MFQPTWVMQAGELSAKILETTGRLFLIRRKLLKRGHSAILSKTAVRLTADIKTRVQLTIKWQRAAMRLCSSPGVQAQLQQTNQSLATWTQSQWLVEGTAMDAGEAAQVAVQSLLGGNSKELGEWPSCALNV